MVFPEMQSSRCLVATFDISLLQLLTESGERVVTISAANGQVNSLASCRICDSHFLFLFLSQVFSTTADRPVLDGASVLCDKFGFYGQIEHQLLSAAQPAAENEAPTFFAFHDVSHKAFQLRVVGTLDPFELRFSYEDVRIANEVI